MTPAFQAEVDTLLTGQPNYVAPVGVVFTRSVNSIRPFWGFLYSSSQFGAQCYTNHEDTIPHAIPIVRYCTVTIQRMKSLQKWMFSNPAGVHA